MTLQFDESAHVILLAVPTWILQVALVLHATVDISPSLKSQFELAVHVTLLTSPPIPLHSDESLHMTVSESVEFPLHLALLVQLSEHAESPHSVLQSAPAAHKHAESVHVQPAPVHVGAALSPPPPQAVANANRIEKRAQLPVFIGLASSAVTGRSRSDVEVAQSNAAIVRHIAHARKQRLRAQTLVQRHRHTAAHTES
ncbi:MAG: hypothetical protein H0T65_26950 [Deltaproteobacteria bacterium]|nr:hypothetical protein [Deltaproteobacteria bacterium]